MSKKTVKPKRGRPSKFTPELGADICNRIVNQLSLLRVCKAEDMPSFGTVYDWDDQGRTDIADGKKETPKALFSVQFARAREKQAHAMMMDAQDIADDGSNDWEESEKGPRLNSEHVARSRLRVETRMKLAERLAPKIYAPMQKMADSEGGKLPAAAVTPLQITLTTKAEPSDA